ncbi:HD domain-containing protein [Hahella ganghwensis]|uniref:HD domain-containing protein n=1 Tax=Hahella ganghwensis TaxID=286420 RepID=UPI00037FAE9E|nr:HD domain-containing protein [Hahella ganghwensis]
MRHIHHSDLSQYRTYLLSLLNALEGIIQPPKYHPESDALYHSLQVFDLAHRQSTDPELWAAALFHDVGKSVDQKTHAQVGAEMVDGIFSPRVTWLISHHLDLLVAPRKTRLALAGADQYQDLILLRDWDLKGRSVFAEVTEPETATDLVLSGLMSSSTDTEDQS